jgi:predicted GH43/DUF377 family glycosyl hydrolase
MKIVIKFTLIFSLIFLRSNNATSQIVWHNYTGVPVMPTWSENLNDPTYYVHTIAPSIIFDSTNKIYHCWFTSKANRHHTRLVLSYAISFDGIRWFSYSKNPVLESTLGTFDENEIKGCSVIKDSVGYKLYYTGYKSSTDKRSIGLALSSDGIRWQKYNNNPVLEGASILPAWDRDIEYPNVYFDGTKYWMWYSGSDRTKSQTGLAISTDGIHWEKSNSNPVLSNGPSGAWDENDAGCGAICKIDSLFYMMYLGTGDGVEKTTSIGIAVSVDGISWNKSVSNPVMRPSKATSWEDYRLGRGALLFRDNKFHFWYCSQNYSSGIWQIGYATSLAESSILNDLMIKLSSDDGFRYLRRINFGFGKGTNIKFNIFNYLGIKVKTFSQENANSRPDSIEWDGKDDMGNVLPDGIYLCSINQYRNETLEKSVAKKLLLIK